MLPPVTALPFSARLPPYIYIIFAYDAALSMPLIFAAAPPLYATLRAITLRAIAPCYATSLRRPDAADDAREDAALRAFALRRNGAHVYAVFMR